VIAALGISGLVTEPVVLTAVDPRHAFAFFREHGWHGFAVLGAVFLVVTGGEALYADMGHFAKRPIRIAWFGLVLPALLLNYFGQGALLLGNPNAAEQPFFLLAPGWALLPLVGLATAAAIIASQALISGAFSLTRQAIPHGYCPRLDIEHTSSHEIGQVVLTSDRSPYRPSRKIRRRSDQQFDSAGWHNDPRATGQDLPHDRRNALLPALSPAASAGSLRADFSAPTSKAIGVTAMTPACAAS
jgi:hypothetical protein